VVGPVQGAGLKTNRCHAWMLLLGAVMATEKNMPWGRRLSAPLGIALVASGLITVLFHL